MADISNEQLDQYINAYIGYLSIHEKNNMVRLLHRNGVAISNNATNAQLLAAIYATLPKSPRFKNELITFMTRHAGNEMGAANQNIDPILNFADPFDFTLGAEGDALPLFLQPPTETTTTTAPVPFSQTGFGSLLGTIFSKDNINKYIGLGVSALQNKMNSNATSTIPNQVAYTQGINSQNLPQQPSGNSWVMPVIIGVSVVAVIIIIIVAVKKSKK